MKELLCSLFMHIYERVSTYENASTYRQVQKKVYNHKLPKNIK